MKTQRVMASLNIQFKKLMRQPGYLVMLLLFPLMIGGMLYLFTGKVSVPMSGKTIFDTMVPGLLVMPALVGMIFVSISFSQVKGEGLLKRIYTTPTTAKEFLGSVIITNSIIAIVQIGLLSVFIALTGFQYNASVAGIALAGLIITIFYIGTIGFGLICAILAKTIQNGSGYANLYSMPQLNIMFFTLPEAELFRKFMPVYYPMDALTLIFDGIALTNFNIWIDFAINLIITMVIIIIAILLFKRHGKT
ncbi:MAG: ABC transporter permease [Promethearchaeota archaeon]